MQNNKYLYLWLGLVLMIFSAIKFYNQPLPPNSEFMLKVYNYLHGVEKVTVRSSGWYDNVFHFDASRQDENYFYILHYVRFTDKSTVFHFTVKPSRAKGSSKTTELPQNENMNSLKIHGKPFPDPVIGTVTDGQLLGSYPLLSKEIKQSTGTLTADLYFPLINRSAGEIRFWHNYSQNSADYASLFNLVTSENVPEIRGSTVWGIVFLLGLILSIKGISSNPIKAMRKVLVKEVHTIDEEKNKSLERILGWSGSFKKLSEKDQNRYTSVVSFFDEIQNSIVDSYRYLPFRTSGIFEKGLQVLLLLSMVFLSSVLVFLCFTLIIEPNESIEKFMTMKTSYANLPLDIRIANLEISEIHLRNRLFLFVLLCAASIIVNYVLGVWRVKQIARQGIGSRLVEYDKTLAKQIKMKTKTIADSIETIEKRMTDIEDNYDNKLIEASSLGASGKYELEFSCNSRLKEIKKGFKKMVKTFKHDLKSHLKSKRGENAET